MIDCSSSSDKGRPGKSLLTILFVERQSTAAAAAAAAAVVVVDPGADLTRMRDRKKV